MENYDDGIKNIKDRISLYFDNELNEGDKNNFLDTIQNNPTFTQMFNHEKKVREQLKHHVQRPHANNDLIKRIRDHIKLS